MMKELERHYDFLAEKYASIHPLRYALVDFLKDKIFSKELNKPFGKIVDFGCGSGELLCALAKQIPFPDLITGVDLSSSMVQKARLKGLDVVNASFEKVFFERGTVVLGVFQESIHHADFNLLGPNLNRIMSPDGQLIVFYQTDWSIDPETKAMNVFIDFARSKRTGPDRIIKALSLFGWSLNEEKLIEDRQSVSFSFLEEALALNALSYWVAFDDKQKLDCINDIKDLLDERDLVLKRNVKAMVFKRRLTENEG